MADKDKKDDDKGKKSASQKRRARRRRAKQQKAVFASIQQQFGLTDALLDLDKTNPKKGFTLKEAFDQIRRDDIRDPARAAQILAKTDWFKTYGPEATKRMAAEKSGLGSFEEAVKAQRAQIADSLAQLGISLDAKSLDQLARDSYVYGFNASQVVDKAVAGKFSYTGGGEVGDALDNLNAMAYANGVVLSARDRDAWARAIAGGADPGEYESIIREQAATTYAPFADQIRGGMNLSDIVQPYRQAAAQLLEVAPDEIDWDDPLFRDGKGFMQTGEDGQMGVKPLWQFRKDVMADQRWQYTDNARERYADFGVGLLQKFGMA